MRTLVLNAGYEPLAVVSFKRALVLVMNEKATVVEHIDGDPVWGARRGVRTPCGHPADTLRARPRQAGTSRSPVVGCCVATRTAAPTARRSASTIDHVLPRSRGGADSWENLVACCLRCNNVKGDRTPQEMGWELRLVPRPPDGAQWTVRGTERTDPRWEPYLELAA